MIGCLCIHGYTGGPYEVEPVAEHLKKSTDWQVEVPCLPGHGEHLDLKGVTYEQWVTAAEQELEKLTRICDEIYLIGFSMGGMIASYLAAKYDVSKLALLSPAGKYLSFKQMGVELAGFAVKGIKGKLKDDPLYSNYRWKLGSVPLTSMLEFQKCVRFARPYLGKINCPVMIAQGRQDSMVPYKTLHYLDKEISSETQLILYDNSKHHICLGEEKEELAQAVYSFLTSDRGDLDKVEVEATIQ
ncbi:alpha/beta hydrolase [Sediminibacillus albus]|uniref:Esterase/lipase n=1 Tax=Sediminibacillus albus TaxID=407036 RepID=A0A1G9AVE8_9BACI|nr:alpha/beta fold hydrolase [Sediminibacillus albus]SDK30874.1 Esterase/lipase [Sediminibacillus albus]